MVLVSQAKVVPHNCLVSFETRAWAVTYGLHHIQSVPVRNGDRVIGELSRGNELPNVFLQRSRWLERFHENILQARQHFYYFALKAANGLFQGGHDTWRKTLGYVEILHCGKWK